ncbi:hypothetical protein [Ferruginibacter sp.]
MKVFITILTIAFFFSSCQRELFFDGSSEGVFRKDLSGNCLPFKVNGNFETDSTLNNQDFIEVPLHITSAGNYTISSDTVNGYYFHQSGNIDAGDHVLRVYATGMPKKEGSNCFTLTYGANVCTACIKVHGPRPAVFTLAGAPNLCTGIYADGSYITNKALTASNILTVQAIVDTPGTYTIKASTTNGFSFADTGVFTNRGLQTVVLKGKGTPVKAEVSEVTVSNVVSNCKLGITVLSDTAGKAMFTFSGSPTECINFKVNGTYYAGIATDISNTITMDVNVIKIGTYDIITNTENGLTFSCSGSFTSTGPQTVILAAKGTPARVELTAFIPNTGTVSCYFHVNVKQVPPPAVFTLSGAPGACTPATVNGFYIVSKPLDAANTVMIQVDVATPGSYAISSNTIDGITFNASGVFSSTGLQQVLLRGSGVPLATGMYSLTPRYISSACSFTIMVQ